MAEETVEGVPRHLIPWYPTIDYDKCTVCGSCVEYCTAGGFGVFAFEEKDGKKRPIVKNPNNCIVFCRGCEDKEVCPTGAISHQSDEETQKIIEKLQKDTSQ
ncbi:MAG: 4Fe-4S dicluster domain-containing protein [Candidatus Bathyarchaeia archaeon]|jgi:NAD-dependent dihydropyrimidine dehydrogenase PreA subunit